MLTQTKAGPSSLVFQTPGVCRPRSRPRSSRLLIAITVASTDWPRDRRRGSRPRATELAIALFDDYVLAFEVVSVLLLAAVIGGVFLAKRERGEPRLMLSGLDGISQSLDAYLSCRASCSRSAAFGFLARRNAIAMLMSIELMLNAVNLSIIAFGAFTHVAQRGRVGHRADRHGRRGGRGDRRPRDRDRHLPQPEDAAGRRVRRDAAVGAMHLLPTLLLAATEASRRHGRPRHLPAADRLIPLLPILGFAFTALFGRRLQARFGRGAAEIVPVGADRPRPG